MELQEIKQKIHQKFPGEYNNEAGLSLLLQKVENMEPTLREKLESFLNDESFEDVEIEGYSVQRLKDKHSMNEIAAFMTLDWLSREPEKAKASLQKGRELPPVFNVNRE